MAVLTQEQFDVFTRMRTCRNSNIMMILSPRQQSLILSFLSEAIKVDEPKEKEDKC